MFNGKYSLSQTYETIVYDWREYNNTISELNNTDGDKERAQKAVDYMAHRDLSDNRYLFLFETARKISEQIDINQIETIPFSKRYDFMSETFQQIYNYFGISDNKFKIKSEWIPVDSKYGQYYLSSKDNSNIIWINEPAFYTKHKMILYTGVFFHEFWHYLQKIHPNKIEYFFSDEKLNFNKYKLRGRYKWILYRNKPMEQEGWFAGYALIYFLNKKNKFKHASKMMKKLAEKSDKEVIDVLRNIDKEKL